MLVEQLAPLAVEADADGDVVPVHQLDPRRQLLRRAAELVAKVRVDIDDRKLGPRQLVLLDLQHRPRAEVLQ